MQVMERPQTAWKRALRRKERARVTHLQKRGKRRQRGKSEQENLRKGKEEDSCSNSSRKVGPVAITGSLLPAVERRSPNNLSFSRSLIQLIASLLPLFLIRSSGPGHLIHSQLETKARGKMSSFDSPQCCYLRTSSTNIRE